MGHVTEDCYIFKIVAEKLIWDSLITMKACLVDPSQPHAWNKLNQAANVNHYSVNVIHASVAFAFLEPDMEEVGTSQTRPTRWRP